MVEAVRAAIEDCDGSPPGGDSPGGRRLAAAAQSLRVTQPLSWRYRNPGLPVASALGMDPAEMLLATTGGNNPQSLVNATSLAIGRGELDVAVLVGADCVYTQAAARRHPDRPVLAWTVQPPDAARPPLFGNDQRATTEAEEDRGLDLPIHVYPLFENALRAGLGRSLDDHRRRIGALWSRFSEVAATNPYAWFRDARSVDEIITVTDSNRMIDYPYTKLLTADMQVDQGAAIIMCSAAAAASAGIPRERWVFPLAGADADDHWFLSHRLDFHSSPAIRLAGRSALSLAGAGIDDVAHVDLYSCFPSAVEIAAAELGLADDDPSRPLTVTGGLTFGGGPGNNYGTHAVASMIDVLRADPGSLGLVTGVGWYLTKHSIGIYGTEPPGSRPGAGGTAADSPGTTGAATPGTSPRGPRPTGRAGSPGPRPSAPSPPSLSAHRTPMREGEVTVETYSVSYGREGAARRRRGGLPHAGRASGLGQRHRSRPLGPAGHRRGMRPARHPPARWPGRPGLTGSRRGGRARSGGTRARNVRKVTARRAPTAGHGDRGTGT